MIVFFSFIPPICVYRSLTEKLIFSLYYIDNKGGCICPFLIYKLHLIVLAFGLKHFPKFHDDLMSSVEMCREHRDIHSLIYNI